MGLLHTLVMFVIAIGVLITVHEYGHYWVARRVGIKVYKFSVGFGPALFSRTGRDGVEWVIAAIPLGGYVKMAGEAPGEESDLPPADRERAYSAQPVPQRMAVAAAGPVMNFLFAAVAFIAVYMIGVQGVMPRIGYVAPESPAAEAGLHVGDTLTAVGDREVRAWSEARVALMEAAMDGARVRLGVADGDASRFVPLDLAGVPAQGVGRGFLLEGVGLAPYQPITVAEVAEGSPAASAGLAPGDRIRAVSGEAVASWARFVEVIRAHPGESVTLTLEREGTEKRVEVTPAERTVDSGETVGHIGLRPQPLPDDLRVTVRHGPVQAVGEGLAKTGEMLRLTVEMLGGMLTGTVTSDNLGGPIAIAQFAGESAEAGLVPFLWFLAMISLSLGFLNLLPIPVLDGGHLLFQAIEAIQGRPVSEATMLRWQQAGIFVLLAIMLFAFYNDLQRIFL